MGCCFSDVNDNMKPLLIIPDIPEYVFVPDIQDVLISDPADTSETLEDNVI